MKNILLLFIILPFLVTGCGMYNTAVRNSWKNKKIVYQADTDNRTKAINSTFKTYMILKTSRGCDFDITQFLSFSSYTYNYNLNSSTAIDIYTSSLTPKQLYVTLANVLDDSFTKKNDGSYKINTYLLEEDETLLSKNLQCEIVISVPSLEPGTYDASSVSLTITDSFNKILYNSNDTDSKLFFEITEIRDKILHANITGTSKKDSVTFDIHSGELWVKM